MWSRAWFIVGLAFVKHRNNITGVNSMITRTKCYVPVVTLSRNDGIKVLQNMKQRFKIKISWYKCRSEIETQPKTAV